MNDWTARVEWIAGYVPGEAELDEWTDKLAEHSVAFGVPGEQDKPRLMSATISLQASTLRQATQDALRLVEGATGSKALAVEVLPTHEFDRRLDEPQIPELVGYAEIADILGVSRQRAREIATTIKPFPAPAVVVATGPLFVRSSVESFANTWERKPGRPKAATVK